MVDMVISESCHLSSSLLYLEVGNAGGHIIGLIVISLCWTVTHFLYRLSLQSDNVISFDAHHRTLRSVHVDGIIIDHP